MNMAVMAAFDLAHGLCPPAETLNKNIVTIKCLFHKRVIFLWPL